MQLTGHITPDSLMSLEAYSKWRKTHKGEVIAHRQLRSVALGEHLNVQFESELTIRYQIQEMLRIEKIFEEEGIQSELDAYNPLVPDGSNWKATMLLEYPEVDQRRERLAQLKGIEDKTWVKVAGHQKVFAIADEDLDRENEEKTSSVHFLRFELDEAMKRDLRDGAPLSMGVDHPNYNESVDPVAAEVRAALLNDLVF